MWLYNATQADVKGVTGIDISNSTVKTGFKIANRWIRWKWNIIYSC